MPEEKRRATQSSILEEAAVVNVSELHLHTEEPEHKRSRGETKLIELLEDIMDCQQQGDTGGQDQHAEKELHKYISEDPVTDNPLTWWQSNQVKYPVLSSLARKYLCIPATSVPSERAFRTAGHVVNRKRACLNPDSVNMLVFLVENLSKCN